MALAGHLLLAVAFVLWHGPDNKFGYVVGAMPTLFILFAGPPFYVENSPGGYYRFRGWIAYTCSSGLKRTRIKAAGLRPPVPLYRAPLATMPPIFPVG